MGHIYFLLGGARSGKSSYSEELAEKIGGSVAYLATAQITDEEMKKRIEVHKKRRPAHWTVFEIKRDAPLISDVKSVFENAVGSGHKIILIDCITNLLFRLVYRFNLDSIEVIDNILEETIENEVLDFFDRFLALVSRLKSKNDTKVIIVSNEVGMGLVPAYPFGRIFRDLMGIINRKIAAISDEAYFFIAGIPQRIK
ncbi:MAG: bifunctional adenosylcobinamide kinase/adenosylcobinamide-phosphate guanylyltransferase [Actinobacteria bacterium]|nr:bifunctional adenosylcobinamide kinase/adenosylcobinamide-phosphate guanylyltransferase [Actinomycetota bacterium]